MVIHPVFNLDLICELSRNLQIQPQNKMSSRVQLAQPLWVEGDRGRVQYYIHGTDPELYYLCVIREWLKPELATRCFEYARGNFTWSQAESRMPIPASQRVPGGGEFFKEPRLTHFVGDRESPPHIYSGIPHPLSPWDPMSRALRDRVVRETGVYFDAALANYYRDGNDSISAHSDTESIGELSTVCGVNLGGTRRLYFYDRKTKETIKTEMHNGDAYLMAGDNFQARFSHTVPKQKGVQPRISLTFRNVGYVYVPYEGQKPRE